MSTGMKILAMMTAVLLITTGCVSKKSFDMLASETSKLQDELGSLRDEQLQLQAAYDAQSRELADLRVKRDNLQKQVASLTDNNRELENILSSREDSLSRTIAEQRQEMARREVAAEIKSREADKLLAARDAEIKKLQETLANLNTELERLSQAKEKETRELSSTYEALLGNMKAEIEQGQVTISELKGKLTVNLVEAVLFDSGRAKIKSDGLKVLQKVTDILRDVHDRTVRIEGHTDNVPISGGLARKYASNWELSAARAVNVTRFLQEKGIAPERLAAVAYGEYHPVAPNDTPEGRAKNRRIEIVLAAAGD